MPINRLAERDEAELGAYDILKRRPEEIDKAITDTRSTALASRQRFAENTGNLIASLASRHGFQGDATAAAAPGMDRAAQNLKLQEDEALSMQRMQERRDNIANTFNFMSSRLQEKGVDRQQAEAVAMQFAMDEDARKFTSEQNKKVREHRLKEQDILDEYANRQVALEEKYRKKNAIKAQIFKSFFGLVGTGVGAMIGGPGGAMVGSTLGATVGGIGGAQVGSRKETTGDFVPKDDKA